jgi:predicted  nucleic acid-binding Zn-ribbon protein
MSHTQVVGPKRAKLAEAEVTLAAVMKALAAKQAELAAVEAKLSELGTQLDAAKLKKANLEVGGWVGGHQYSHVS